MGDGQEENEGENEAETVKYWNPVFGDDPILEPQWQWGTATSSSNKMYYNFYAAVAGGNGQVGDQSDSICPAGWGLPAESKILRLFRAYVSNYAAGVRPDMVEALITTAPMVFSFSGRYTKNGDASDLTNDFVIWTNHAYNGSVGRAANYGLIHTGNGAESYAGAGTSTAYRQPVRCVKD